MEVARFIQNENEEIHQQQMAAQIAALSCVLPPSYIHEAVKTVVKKSRKKVLNRREANAARVRDFRYDVPDDVKTEEIIDMLDKFGKVSYSIFSDPSYFVRQYSYSVTQELLLNVNANHPSFQNIQKIDISSQLLGDERFIQLCEHLKRSPSIIFLNFTKNNLKDSALTTFAKIQRSLKSLKFLNLSENDFSDEGVAQLFSLENFSPTLECVDLSSNILGPKSALSIGYMFSSHDERRLLSHLHTLYLGGTQNGRSGWGDNFLRLLVALLVRPLSNRLKKISIPCGNLSDEGLRSLALLLSSAGTELTYLNIIRNPISSPSTKRMLRLALHLLSLNHTNKELMRATSKCPLQLFLGQNGLTPLEKKQFMEVASSSHTYVPWEDKIFLSTELTKEYSFCRTLLYQYEIQTTSDPKKYLKPLDWSPMLSVDEVFQNVDDYINLDLIHGKILQVPVIQELSLDLQRKLRSCNSLIGNICVLEYCAEMCLKSFSKESKETICDKNSVDDNNLSTVELFEKKNKRSSMFPPIKMATAIEKPSPELDDGLVSATSSHPSPIGLKKRSPSIMSIASLHSFPSCLLSIEGKLREKVKHRLEVCKLSFDSLNSLLIKTLIASNSYRGGDQMKVVGGVDKYQNALEAGYSQDTPSISQDLSISRVELDLDNQSLKTSDVFGSFSSTHLQYERDQVSGVPIFKLPSIVPHSPVNPRPPAQSNLVSSQSSPINQGKPPNHSIPSRTKNNFFKTLDGSLSKNVIIAIEDSKAQATGSTHQKNDTHRFPPISHSQNQKNIFHSDAKINHSVPGTGISPLNRFSAKSNSNLTVNFEILFMTIEDYRSSLMEYPLALEKLIGGVFLRYMRETPIQDNSLEIFSPTREESAKTLLLHQLAPFACPNPKIFQISEKSSSVDTSVATSVDESMFHALGIPDQDDVSVVSNLSEKNLQISTGSQDTNEKEYGIGAGQGITECVSAYSYYMHMYAPLERSLVKQAFDKLKLEEEMAQADLKRRRARYMKKLMLSGLRGGIRFNVHLKSRVLPPSLISNVYGVQQGIQSGVPIDEKNENYDLFNFLLGGSPLDPSDTHLFDFAKDLFNKNSNLIEFNGQSEQDTQPIDEEGDADFFSSLNVMECMNCRDLFTKETNVNQCCPYSITPDGRHSMRMKLTTIKRIAKLSRKLKDQYNSPTKDETEKIEIEGEAFEGENTYFSDDDNDEDEDEAEDQAQVEIVQKDKGLHMNPQFISKRRQRRLHNELKKVENQAGSLSREELTSKNNPYHISHLQANIKSNAQEKSLHGWLANIADWVSHIGITRNNKPNNRDNSNKIDETWSSPWALGRSAFQYALPSLRNYRKNRRFKASTSTRNAGPEDQENIKANGGNMKQKSIRNKNQAKSISPLIGDSQEDQTEIEETLQTITKDIKISDRINFLDQTHSRDNLLPIVSPENIQPLDGHNSIKLKDSSDKNHIMKKENSFETLPVENTSPHPQSPSKKVGEGIFSQITTSLQHLGSSFAFESNDHPLNSRTPEVGNVKQPMSVNNWAIRQDTILAFKSNDNEDTDEREKREDEKELRKRQKKFEKMTRKKLKETDAILQKQRTKSELWKDLKVDTTSNNLDIDLLFGRLFVGTTPTATPKIKTHASPKPSFGATLSGTEEARMNQNHKNHSQLNFTAHLASPIHCFPAPIHTPSHLPKVSLREPSDDDINNSTLNSSEPFVQKIAPSPSQHDYNENSKDFPLLHIHDSQPPLSTPSQHSEPRENIHPPPRDNLLESNLNQTTPVSSINVLSHPSSPVVKFPAFLSEPHTKLSSLPNHNSSFSSWSPPLAVREPIVTSHSWIGLIPPLTPQTQKREQRGKISSSDVSEEVVRRCYIPPFSAPSSSSFIEEENGPFLLPPPTAQQRSQYIPGVHDLEKLANLIQAISILIDSELKQEKRELKHKTILEKIDNQNKSFKDSKTSNRNSIKNKTKMMSVNQEKKEENPDLDNLSLFSFSLESESSPRPVLDPLLPTDIPSSLIIHDSKDDCSVDSSSTSLVSSTHLRPYLLTPTNTPRSHSLAALYRYLVGQEFGHRDGSKWERELKEPGLVDENRNSGIIDHFPLPPDDGSSSASPVSPEAYFLPLYATVEDEIERIDPLPLSSLRSSSLHRSEIRKAQYSQASRFRAMVSVAQNLNQK